jgi:hypothetical protein
MSIVLCSSQRTIRLIQSFDGEIVSLLRVSKLIRDAFCRLDDLNSKYRFMEMNLLQKKKRLRGKLPDIQICMGMCLEKENNLESILSLSLCNNRYDRTATEVSRERN